MTDALQYLMIPVFAYLFGSIPFGLVFTRLFAAGDIRTQGSGNIGATNVARTVGWRLGAATLFCDVAKGAVPVWLAVSIAGGRGVFPEFYLAAVALSAFSGHLFPFYTEFQHGGKGVATTAGIFFVISPPAGVVSVLVFILMVCLTERVSVGSLFAAAILPLAVWKSTQSEVLTGCALLLMAGIFCKHRANLIRLATGNEPRFGSKVHDKGPDQGNDPRGHEDRLD